MTESSFAEFNIDPEVKKDFIDILYAGYIQSRIDAYKIGDDVFAPLSVNIAPFVSRNFLPRGICDALMVNINFNPVVSSGSGLITAAAVRMCEPDLEVYDVDEVNRLDRRPVLLVNQFGGLNYVFPHVDRLNKKFGSLPLKVINIFNYSQRRAVHYNGNNIPIQSIFDICDMREYLAQNGVVTEEKLESIDDFIKDPLMWQVKRGLVSEKM